MATAEARVVAYRLCRLMKPVACLRNRDSRLGAKVAGGENKVGGEMILSAIQIPYELPWNLTQGTTLTDKCPFALAMA